MLNFFRTKVNSLAGKVILIIAAAGLLVAGVGDVIWRSHSDYVFKMDGYKCTSQEFSLALQRQANMVAQRLERPLTEEELSSPAFINDVMARLIDKQLILLDAERSGVVVSDSMIKEQITTYDEFKTKDGGFNSVAFAEFLKQKGMTENEFMSVMKKDMTYEIMINALGGNLILPPQLTRQLLISEESTKELTVFKVSRADYVTIKQPTDSELKELYERYKRNFSVPESRFVSYFSFKINDVVKSKKQFSEQELKDEYQKRLQLFQMPERRSFSYLSLSDKDAVEAAKAALKAGEAFAEVVKKYSNTKQKEHIIANVSRAELPPKIAEAVFSATVGKLSDPVVTDRGILLLMVDKETPASTTSYEEAKGQLLAQLKDEKEYEDFSSFTKDLNAQISKGANLKALAEKYKFSVSKARLTAGKFVAGSSVLQDTSGFSEVAFAAKDQQVTQVSNEGENFFVLHVDSVEPEVTKPIEDVRSDLIALWRDDVAEKTSYAAAQEIKLQLSQGKKPSKKFSEAKIKIEAKNPVGLPEQLLLELPHLAHDDYSKVALDDKDDCLFIRLDATNMPNKSKFSDIQKLVLPEQSQGRALLIQYVEGLRKKYDVKVNKKLLEKLGKK